jgi:hypothetical protein
MAVTDYASDVFINCPFDVAYRNIFNAIIFSIFDCNFRARCSLELDDGGEARIEKISRIITQCKYGIHDISRTELCAANNLPRFNMPLELGLFLGAKKFGNNDQKKKTCLIMDRERYRYQMFISDIAGQDIKQHENDPVKTITVVVDWLRNVSRRTTIPGGTVVSERFNAFKGALPEICRVAGITEAELGFNDYATFVSEWIKNNLRA